MKKTLLLAALAVACGLQTNWAANTEVFNLDGVVVTDVRDRGVLPGGYADLNGSVGFLGDKPVMKVPFSQINYTAKMLDTFGGAGQPLDTVLQSNPSIRAAGSVLHSDFTFRGFRANGTSMFLNGIPGMFTQFNVPTYFTDRVEITSGPAGGISGTGAQYESTAVGGIINFVSKRAPHEDINWVKFTYSGKSNLGTYLDVARRFGDNEEYGMRINAELVGGETSVKNEKYNASSVYVNLDRQTDKATTNLLIGYRDMEIKNGHRWFKLGADYEKDYEGTPTLLKAPKGSGDYGFPGNVKSTQGYIVALNHDQKMNENWSWFLNAGLNHNNLDSNITGQNSAFTILNNRGDYKLIISDGLNRMHSYYVGAGIRGKLETGNIKHNIVLMMDKSWRNRGGAVPGTNFRLLNIGNANIYNGIEGELQPFSSNPKPMRTYKQRLFGVSLVDTMEIGKWQVLVGGHYHRATGTAMKLGKYTQSVRTHGFSPTYGIVYSPNENTSVYANHSEYFNEGEIVGPSYTNAGTVFQPLKAKQNEVGVKYYRDGLALSLAYFSIKQNEKRFEHLNGPDKPMTQFMDGVIRNRGVELNVNGKLSPKWTVFGGVMYMDAKYEKRSDVVKVKEKVGDKVVERNVLKVLDGRKQPAQPDWTATLGVAYQPNDNMNLFLRGVYTGDSIIRTQASKKEITVPAHTIFDLGARYKTQVAGHDATFGLTVYNLFDKDYWMASRGDQVYVSLPRTLMLSAEFNF